MRAGCIDIGSNTTRLLVAERGAGQPIAVVNERALIALDAGGAVEAEPLRSCVARFAVTARDHGVRADALRIVATAALRALDPDPRRVLIDELTAIAGCRVEVLSPQREAGLAFAGATGRRDARSGPVAVIDVGGGSTELIVGRPGKPPDWWASIPVGTRSLTERALHGDPPSPAQLAAARSLVAEALTAAIGGCGPPPAVRRALTVGGGSTALGRILCGTPAEPDGLADALRTLTAVTAAEVAAHHGIEPERARRLPATALLLGALLARLRVSAEPAGGGLREGVIAELLGR